MWDEEDYSESPEVRYLWRSDIRPLVTITADTTGHEIVGLADKLWAKAYTEEELELDINELVRRLDQRRER